MNKTLYLTQEEKKLFEALSAEVREGWEVSEETQRFEDTDERRAVRCRRMRIRDSQLTGLAKKMENVKTDEEFKKLVDEIDFTRVSNDDMSELFFCLGPQVIGLMLTEQLREVHTDDDVEVAASLSAMRHLLLESFIPAYA